VALTINQIADILFKKVSAGNTTTNNSKQYFEEGITAKQSVFNKDIWIESHKIPSVNPLISTSTGDAATYIVNGEPIIEKISLLQLQNIAGSQSFTHPRLKNIIPFNFDSGGTYNYVLRTNVAVSETDTSNGIALGSGDWYLDTEGGVLTFFGTFPSGAVSNASPPKITVYKYIGKKLSDIDITTLGDSNLTGATNGLVLTHSGTTVELAISSLQTVGSVTSDIFIPISSGNTQYKITKNDLFAALLGQLNYKGTWNATTNSPTLVSSTGTKGDFYVIAVSGSTSLDGFSTWEVADLIVFNGNVWEEVKATNSVVTVFSRVGNIIGQYGDYSANQIYFSGTSATLSGLTSVQSAIQALDSAIANAPKIATGVTNGISIINQNIALGGNLIADTNISQGSFNLNLTGGTTNVDAFKFGKGFIENGKIVTSNYTVSTSDYMIFVSANTATISFSGTPALFQSFLIIDAAGNAEANNITLSATINNSSSATIDSNYGGIRVTWSGTQFNITGFVV